MKITALDSKDILEKATGLIGRSVFVVTAGDIKYKCVLCFVTKDSILVDNIEIFDGDIISAYKKTFVNTENKRGVSGCSLISVNVIEGIELNEEVDIKINVDEKVKKWTEADCSCMEDFIKQLLGHKVAFLCNRYQYRGILSTVTQDCVILSDPTSVEISGPSREECPQYEDPLDDPILINFSMIEIVWQPKWCFALLPSEDGYKESRNRW